jgi:hypothetical protein
VTDPQLRDLLDSSFGDGPTPPTPADRLPPGRRALRRRRLASGAATLATAAAVTAAAVLVSGGDGGTRAVEPAAPAVPTPSAASTLPSDGPAYGGAYSSQLCLGFDGVEPTEEELNDLDLDYDPSTGTLACSQGDGGTAELEVEPQLGESRLVRFADAGSELLVAPAGVEILDQSGDVDLPADFAGPRDRTAVARVRADDSPGGVVYVLARQLGGGPPEYIAEPDRRDRWPTIAAFLDHAAEQYAGGEGLR